jgi:hypothetical protein
MQLKCVVLYQDHMVFYSVFTEDGWHYQAVLLKCKDHPVPPPPSQISLRKEGMCWHGNADEDLVRFLGFDIDQQLKRKTIKTE